MKIISLNYTISLIIKFTLLLIILFIPSINYAMVNTSGLYSHTTAPDLNNTLVSINQGKINKFISAPTSCDTIDGFINQVNTREKNTELTAADASSLRESATIAKSLLKCN